MVEQDSIPNQGGGSIPTSPHHFILQQCKFSDISDIFRQFHYKSNHMGGGIMFNFMLTWNCIIIGGAVVGKTRWDKKYSTHGDKYIEIRRLACIQRAPKNTESYFISKIIWFIKKHTDITHVISYADQSVGHVGTIYKAANFKLVGKTSSSKYVFWNDAIYHQRSLTIDRPYSYRLRAAIKSGEAQIISGLPKLIYVYKIPR